MFSGNVRRIATIVTAEDQATSTLSDASSAGDQTADSFEGTESSARGMAGAFAASAAVTTGLVATLGSLVRAHGRTEQTFSRMQAVSGATDEEMEQIIETASRVGRDLPVSMGQAADAMEQLSFAGFDAEESMAAAEGVANIATASIMEMGETATTTAQILNAFDLEAQNINQVTSSLAGTFSSSAINLQQLADGMQRVAPVANTVGVEVQEAAAAVGVLADQGMSGRRAAGGLREVLQRITDEGQAGDTLRDINVEIDDLLDSEGELRNLNEVFGTLAEGFDEAEGQADRLRIATELAGRRGARALLPLLDNTDELSTKIADNMRTEIKGAIGDLRQLEDEEIAEISTLLGMDDPLDPQDFGPVELIEHFEELHEQGESQEDIQLRMAAAFDVSDDSAQALARDVTDASVSADELAESIGGMVTASELGQSQMNTTAGAVEFFRSSFDAMKFAILQGVGPSIEWLAMRMGDFVNILNSDAEVMERFGQLLIGLTLAFAGVTAAIGAKMVALSGFGSLLGTAASSVGLFTGQLFTLTKIKTLLSGASIPALIGSITMLLKPILAVVAVVGVLIATFEALKVLFEEDIMGLQTNIETISSAFRSAFGGIQSAATALMPAVRVLAHVLGVVVGGALAVVVAGIVSVVAEVVRFSEAVWTVIDAIVPFGAIVEYGGAAVDQLREAFEVAEPHIQTFLGVMGQVWDVVSPVVRILGGIALAVGMVGAGFLAVVNPVTAAVGAVVGAALLLGGVWDIVTGIFDAANWRELGVTALSAIAGGIVGGIQLVVDAVQSMAESLMSLLPGSDADTGPLSNLSGVGPKIPGMIASGIRSAADAPVESLWSVFDTLLELHPLGDLYRQGGQIILEVAAGLSDRARAVYSEIDEIFGSPEELLDPRNWLRAGRVIIEAVADGYVAAQSAVVSALDDAIPLPLDVLELDQYREAGVSLMRTLRDGIESAASAPVDAVSNMASDARDRLPFSDAPVGPLSDLTASGQSLLRTFGEGVSDERQSVVNAMSDTLTEAREYLPFSDAQQGPLADLTESGASMMSTIASGVQSNNDVIGEAMNLGSVASNLTDVGGDAGSSVAAGMDSLRDDPLDPRAAAQAASDELQSDSDDSAGGTTEITLSVEQDITINAEQSVEQIREQIERLIEDGATDALRQLERKISNGEGLNL